jgi:hypothetical protein
MADHGDRPDPRIDIAGLLDESPFLGAPHAARE